MRTLAALVLAAGTTLAGGGFWLTTFSAASPLGRQTPDAVVLVAAQGCASAETLKFSGTAEGVIAGARRSVPLDIVPTSKHGVWAVKNASLPDGRWIFVVRATLPGGITLGTLVEPRPDGSYRSDRTFSAQELPTRLEAALRAKAD